MWNSRGFLALRGPDNPFGVPPPSCEKVPSSSRIYGSSERQCVLVREQVLLLMGGSGGRRW